MYAKLMLQSKLAQSNNLYESTDPPTIEEVSEIRCHAEKVEEKSK